MPRLLAQTVAQFVAESETEEDARDAARSTLALAAENQYCSPEFVQEIGDALREIAEREVHADRRRFILAAVQFVCDAADELSAGSGLGQSP